MINIRITRAYLVYLLMLILIGCGGKEPGPARPSMQGPYDLGELGKKDHVVLFDSLRYGDRRVFLEQNVPESFMAFPMDYLIDDSLIYILDGQTPVKVFDKQGNFVSVLGGHGEGPGEYLAAGQVFKCHDMIGVYDMVGNRFVFYRDLEYVYGFSFYTGGNLFDDPVCHDRYIYISVRGFTPEWPYHLLKIDTTGNVLKAAFYMRDQYYAYFLTGLFYAQLFEGEKGIALAHALYKRIFYFDYDLDSLYSAPLVMPPRCAAWQWPERSEIDIGDENEVNTLRALVNRQAPCVFVSVFPYRKYMVYNYLVGENVDTKLPISIVYDPEDNSRVYLVGSGRIYIREDEWSECGGDMEFRVYCDFFQIDLSKAKARLADR